MEREIFFLVKNHCGDFFMFEADVVMIRTVGIRCFSFTKSSRELIRVKEKSKKCD